MHNHTRPLVTNNDLLTTAATTPFTTTTLATFTNNNNMIRAISNPNVTCTCGQVQLAIDSPSALRLVCYSKDYRGYYQWLQQQAQQHGHTNSPNKNKNAPIDPWGGVDLVQIYPSEITILAGKELCQTVLIRPGSPTRRVYASCCDTPLFDIGSLSAMVNTSLLTADDADKLLPVHFRILGRHALPNNKLTQQQPKKPSMSWSIPWSWLFVMGRRIDKSKMEPLPLDISQPKVIPNFEQG